MLRSLLAAAVVSVALPAAAGEAGLDRSEIAEELVGKQIAWWEEAGWRHGYLMLLPGGAAEMTIDRPEPQHDVGRWSMRGDEICTQWGEARGGTEKCYRISRDAQGLFVTTGGNVFEVRELGV